MVFGRRRPLQDDTPSIETYISTIERTLSSMNIDPKTARRDMESGYGWNFRQGSATIEIYLKEVEEESYLQVLSPILYLPTTNLLPLYRHLLELNMQLTNAALGIYLDVVFVFNERPLKGMDENEARDIIQMIAGYADELDNRLVNEFGGRLYGQV